MPQNPQGRPAPETPERVNVHYRSRNVPNRTGWLDIAIGCVLVVMLAVAFWMLKGVR